MAPLDVGSYLAGMDTLGQVGSHFLLPSARESPLLINDPMAQADRLSRSAPSDLTHLQGILRRRQLYCRTGFHLQILPDGNVMGTRQDHNRFGRYTPQRSQASDLKSLMGSYLSTNEWTVRIYYTLHPIRPFTDKKV